MNLPGLVTVQPDRTEELDALARMVGTCFLEEMWYVTWLEALDELGIGRDRKLEITRAVIRSDYEVTAPYQCVYALPDRAGAANVYLRSELGDVDWTELEEESGALLAEVLTDEEIDVLGPRIEAMDPISSTSWPLERAAADEDFIYFISAGVDPEKVARVKAAIAAKAKKEAAAKQAAADEKIANLDPEKAAKVKAALEAKAAREAAKTETEKEGE